MRAGTSKSRKYIPIHEIIPTLPQNLSSLCGFHSLTGSDSTSYISGHSKMTCLKVYETYHSLLQNLGEGELTDDTISNCEKFICRVYGFNECSSVDSIRVKLFCRVVAHEKLPPTNDALKFHVKRAHYQALIWRQADVKLPELPDVETMGWAKDNSGELKPVLKSLEAVPDSCKDVIFSVVCQSFVY